MEFIFLTINDTILIAIIAIVLILALIVNYKIFKKIKNNFIKFLFVLETSIRMVATYYIFYYFILVLSLNDSIKVKLLSGALFVLSLFIPVIPEFILIFFVK